MKRVFEVGDRVYCIGGSSDGDRVKGEMGVICLIDGMSWPPVGVRWDTYNYWKHDCKTSCEHGHGWFVREEDLEFAETDVPEDLDFDMSDLL